MAKGRPKDDILRDLKDNMHHLLKLKSEQADTQAKLIRWCVNCLRSDPRNYRLRGHESSRERQDIINENIRNKDMALLYLEWLATQLEDQR